MRFKIRTKTEEYWYGTGLPERFVDLSSFDNRPAAEARVDALMQQANLNAASLGADVTVTALTPAGTPWVSVEVGDMVRVDGWESGTLDQRVLDLGWELGESGQVTARPVLGSTQQLYADRIERSLARVGNGGLGGTALNIDAVRGELPDNLPSGMYETFSNELTWHKQGPVSDSPADAPWQRVDRPTRYCTYNWSYRTPPTDNAMSFTIRVNGTPAHVATTGTSAANGGLCYVLANPQDLVDLVVDTAKAGPAEDLVVTLMGTNRV